MIMKMYTALSRARVCRLVSSLESVPLWALSLARGSPSRLLLTHTLHDCGPVGRPAGPRS